MPLSSKDHSGGVPGNASGGREVIGGKVYGTIFMGPESERETTLGKLYNAAQREQWNRQTENEYMERVRARATDRVRELLLQARRRGEALEAEARERAERIAHEAEGIRAEAVRDRERAAEELRQAESTRQQAETRLSTAHETGLAEGRAQAREELVQAREELGNATGAVLISIQEQCGAIFEAWRKDLAALVREVAEKGTGLVIRAERAEVLAALLDQSMRALLDKRSFSVRVNPEDADLVADILSDARHVNSRVSVWETVRDPSLEPGSLVVESESALVDNSRAARFSAVDEVLSHLEIPESKADHNAAETVTRTLLHSLRGAGVDVTEEGAEPSEGSVRDSSSEDVASVEKRPEPEEDALPAASSEAAVSAADNGKSGETPAETSAVSGSATEEVREETLPVPELSVRDEPESEAASSAVPGSMAETDKGGSSPVAPESAPDHGELAGTEASELVDAFLGDPGADGHPLPDIVADELLADMGFGPEKERHSNG